MFQGVPTFLCPWARVPISCQAAGSLHALPRGATLWLPCTATAGQQPPAGADAPVRSLARSQPLRNRFRIKLGRRNRKLRSWTRPGCDEVCSGQMNQRGKVSFPEPKGGRRGRPGPASAPLPGGLGRASRSSATASQVKAASKGNGRLDVLQRWGGGGRPRRPHARSGARATLASRFPADSSISGRNAAAGCAAGPACGYAGADTSGQGWRT